MILSLLEQALNNPAQIVKVIPQKLTMKFSETFSECYLPSTVFKKPKMIGHRARLRDVMAKSYPIHACTPANHARYSSVHVTFCGSWIYSLLNLYLGKNLRGRKRRAYGIISHKICRRITPFKTTWT